MGGGDADAAEPFRVQRMALMDKVYDRMRDPAAFKVRPEDAITGTLDGLKRSKYWLLVTFRRDGTAVPSPVWMAVDGQGRGYLHTDGSSGKVKRIRANPEVLITISTIRGRPKGPVLKGKARVLPKEEWAHAEETLASGYGFERKAYNAVSRMADDKQAYVEVVPGG
jgi:PPOX class probable F420-dependent enzyme